MKNELKNIARAKEYFFDKLQPVWGEETSSLFFIWWNEKKGWTRSEIQLNINTEISENEWEELKNAVHRLEKSEPIQYVLGSVPFAGCKILTNKNVLIPRPETEELVYTLVEKLKKWEYPSILDLCTGSGCIALGLKKNISHSKVTATDVSQEALKLAEESATLNQLAVRFINSDVLNDKPIDEKFDLIVSNPPYIPPSDKKEMHKNVLDFEPHLALFTPENDAFLFYRNILDKYVDHLQENGILAFEIHEKLSDEMVRLIEKTGEFSSIECLNDMQGKPRMIIAVKKAK